MNMCTKFCLLNCSQMLWSAIPYLHLSLNYRGHWGITDTSQPVIILCSWLPFWTWQTPGPSIPWCCFPTFFLSTLSTSLCDCALQDVVTRPDEQETCPYLCSLLLFTLYTQLTNLLSFQLAELPESFGQLTQLRVLDLFHNKLTELPACLQHFTNLKFLDLNHVRSRVFDCNFWLYFNACLQIR